MNTHYSQHSEDEFISDFFKDTQNGFFVDIGANDGIKGSNTRALWERGWSGVMVEGSLPTFQALLKNYQNSERIRLVWAAIGARTGVVTFYNHRTDHLCGWNSADAEWINGMNASLYEPTLTPAMTLSDVGLPIVIDFLSVDTEGWDFDVLSGMPVTMNPRLVMAEIDKHNNYTRIANLLESRGYGLVWEETSDGSNAAWAL